jgi:hypothetical protein
MADRKGQNGPTGGPGSGRDGVDTWLHNRIEPLPPPPGTFEAIRRRARRRKYRKLAVSAGAAVVVVAAAVTVPQVVKMPIEKGAPEAAASNTPRNTTPGASPSAPNVESSRTTPMPHGAPVPANFQPASITAVSTTTVFTIGQAGTPGQCATQYCTSVARTQNGGRTWTGLPAPLTGAPDGATGVGQIRFLEGINGWAFGPELWATHDGGERWARIGTGGQRVIDVETVGSRAFAIEGECAGGGQDYTLNCTAFTLYTSPAKADAWTKVGAATSNLGKHGAAGAAALALTGSRGYLLAPNGDVFAGPVDGSAAWQQVSQIPCAVGQAQSNGEPQGALLDASSAKNLVLACTAATNESAGTQTKTFYLSSDYGKSWHQKWSGAPTDGIATSITDSLNDGTVTLATTTGIDVLTTGAGVWQTASLGGTDAGPSGGFSFVGMTDPLRGMALPADPMHGTIWFTADGGFSWSPSRVQQSST